MEFWNSNKMKSDLLVATTLFYVCINLQHRAISLCPVTAHEGVAPVASSEALNKALWFLGSRNCRQKCGIDQKNKTKQNLFYYWLKSCFREKEVRLSREDIPEGPPTHHFTTTPPTTPSSGRPRSQHSRQKIETLNVPQNTEPSCFWTTAVRQVIRCFANSINIMSTGNM